MGFMERLRSTDSGHGFKFFFRQHRSDSTIEGMWPLSVVIPHQIAADILPGCRQTLIAHRRHPLCFQTPEQALHWRVVPAIASATHALHHAVAPKPLPELAADILRPLIRMEHELLRTSSLLPGMIQGL